MRAVPSDRVGVDRALNAVLGQVPPAEFRLVGTASSVLRGIVMPAADIDLLFRDRTDVDAWFAALSTDFDVETAPVWMPDASQYFARLYAQGIPVELSTVEVETDRDTMECFGTGPWQHFDLITCGAGTVPAVASELRLLTEVARGSHRSLSTDRRAPACHGLRSGVARARPRGHRCFTGRRRACPCRRLSA